MAKRVKVAKVGDIPEGEGIAVDVDGERVALFHAEGMYYALCDTCPHAGGPLSEGWIENGSVTCPWHGWQFKLDRDTKDGLPRYTVVVEGEDIHVEAAE